jgi:two-component system cell cycle response regulator DivK
MKGYHVHSLPSGLHFFQAIAEFNPALILLDLKMPGVDGYTLLQQMQTSPFCTIPVIVISAYSLKREKQKAM